MAKDQSRNPARVMKQVLNTPEPLTWASNQMSKDDFDEHQSKMFGKYGGELEDYRAAQEEHERQSREA
jgi:hypothetical protein